MMECMISKTEKMFYFLRFLDAQIVTKDEAEQCAKDGTWGGHVGDDANDFVVVEKILDVAIWANKNSSTTKPNWRYKVRWATFGAYADTWEPACCTQFIVCNTEFIICNTHFIILNAQFIVFNK